MRPPPLPPPRSPRPPSAGTFHFPKRPSLGQVEKAGKHPIATLNEDVRDVPGASELAKGAARARLAGRLRGCADAIDELRDGLVVRGHGQEERIVPVR